MPYLGAERLGKDSGVLCVFLQLKLMPIVSCFKMLIYISHSIRSSYTLKQGNRVIITYTSQNIKPLHRVVGSPMNPHYGGRFSNGILVHGKVHDPPAVYMSAVTWHPYLGFYILHPCRERQFLSKISCVGKQHDYLASVKSRTSKETKSKV